MKCGWFWIKDWCRGVVGKGFGLCYDRVNRLKCRKIWISLKYLMYILLK